MNRERCLILFVKYPEKGKVKTRLSLSMGDDAVVCLSRAFIEDLVENLSQGDYEFRMAVHPAEKIVDFRKEFGNAFSFIPQDGADLGERMLNAFERCFSDGYRSIVIMGSDIPDLPKTIIDEAFQSLEKDGAVIGPAYDGGYYLIGFYRETFLPSAFRGISWGGEYVFEHTVNTLRRSGLRFHVLPQWRDIDRPEDISALIDNSRKTDFTGSRTMACLRDRGIAKDSR